LPPSPADARTSLAGGPLPRIKPAEAGKGAPPKSGAAFRETLWFKQGDVQQMVADAKAKMQSAGKPAAEGIDAISAEDARPLEDRYADDGSVTVEDRKKFSLRTGGTATAMPAVGTHLPGESMDEREIVGEISGTRRTLILIVAAVVVLALIVVVVMMLRGKSRAGAVLPVAVPTAVAIAPPAEPPPPSPSAALDAGVARAAPPGAAENARAGTPGLGAAGGVTKQAAGGVASGTKPAAKKKVVAAAKHPAPKHKR
jgi:hypothetical protein